MAYKTVFFDVGNVLVFFDSEKQLRQLSDVCGATPDEIRAAVIDDKMDYHIETGAVNAGELHRYFQDKWPHNAEKELLWHAFSEIFQLNKAILPLVHALKGAGIRVVILSNISDLHYEYIDREYQIFDLFDELVLSYQVGAMKPEKKIFEAALKVANAEPHECFYTDDIHGHVEAARELGIDGHVFTSVDDLKAQLNQRFGV